MYIHVYLYNNIVDIISMIMSYNLTDQTFFSRPVNRRSTDNNYFILF